jgi:hypothetical protein
MTEIEFLVEDDPDGGYMARALGESIFTEATDLDALRAAVRDAVCCHFGNGATRPEAVRLRMAHGEDLGMVILPWISA